MAPRKAACIIASARNEGPYLLEWVAYHRALGFDRIFLYSNDNDDGSDELLEALARADIVTWIRNGVDRAAPQLKSYAHALSLLPDTLSYEWALVIDIDEFLVLDTPVQTVRRLPRLGRQARAGRPYRGPELALFFGLSGAARYEPGSLVTRATQSASPPRTRISNRSSGPASSRPPIATSRSAPADSTSRRSIRMAVATPMDGAFPISARPLANAAWINHYFSKSLEEMLWKTSRGLGDRSVATIRGVGALAIDAHARVLTQEAGADTLQDTRIDVCVPDLEAEIERLTALCPGIAEASAVIASRSKAGSPRCGPNSKASPARRAKGRIHDIVAAFG